jgi:16S rRNA (guanine527-N7)-methyltransferase
VKVIKRTHLLKVLQAGLQAMGLSLIEAIHMKLLDYIELLCKWNAVHNLTAVRDPEDMIKRHLLDSLVLLPFLSSDKGTRLVDVGTGAGLPGIPLALASPTLQVVLLDSHQKKIAFVQHVILCLQLSNVTAVCARVEQYKPDVRFDFVVSRAFASLSDFVLRAAHLCKKEGKLIAMKGVIDPLEVAAIPAGFTIEKIQPVQVPGIVEPRSLIFSIIS